MSETSHAFRSRVWLELVVRNRHRRRDPVVIGDGVRPSRTTAQVNHVAENARDEQACTTAEDDDVERSCDLLVGGPLTVSHTQEARLQHRGCLDDFRCRGAIGPLVSGVTLARPRIALAVARAPVRARHLTATPRVSRKALALAAYARAALRAIAWARHINLTAIAAGETRVSNAARAELVALAVPRAVPRAQPRDAAA